MPRKNNNSGPGSDDKLDNLILEIGPFQLENLTTQRIPFKLLNFIRAAAVLTPHQAALLANSIRLTADLDWREQIRRMDLPTADPLIVVDDEGSLAWEVGEFLIQAGFEQVFILEGGLASWGGEGSPGSAH